MAGATHIKVFSLLFKNSIIQKLPNGAKLNLQVFLTQVDTANDYHNH